MALFLLMNGNTQSYHCCDGQGRMLLIIEVVGTEEF